MRYKAILEDVGRLLSFNGKGPLDPSTVIQMLHLLTFVAKSCSGHCRATKGTAYSHGWQLSSKIRDVSDLVEA